MLLYLHVKNLALIEETEVEFSDHLNIMTGETGAGKSVLIGSIQYALGGRLSRDMIRKGKDYALVELIFHTDNPIVLHMLAENDIPCEDGEIIVHRKVTATRVINKINDTNVTIAKLKEITPLLLDLSGQHENQLLLSPDRHLGILDSFGKEDLLKCKEAVAKAYGEYIQAKKALSLMDTDEESRRRETEFLKFEINEIESAHLTIGEDEELESLYQKISHAKEIVETCGKVHSLTGSGNPDAGSLIGSGVKMLYDIEAYDPMVSELIAQLSTVDDILNDFNKDLSTYMSDMDFDEQVFFETEQRLDLINHLKSKYGDSIDKILAYQEKNRAKLLEYENYDENIASLTRKEKQAYLALKGSSDQLTAARKSISGPLEEKIVGALLDLNFEKVSFSIDFQSLPEPQAFGQEKICFMISTNPGMDPRPLHEIASGGELSRIMLAIKSVLADKENIDTLIFDEIDTGISGRTAQKVSERLAGISRSRQVIAITHLPQIAAMADNHFLIEKTSSEDSTISHIYSLNEAEKAKELARMLGGAMITDAVYQNAIEMIHLADNYKKENNK